MCRGSISAPFGVRWRRRGSRFRRLPISPKTSFRAFHACDGRFFFARSPYPPCRAPCRARPIRRPGANPISLLPIQSPLPSFDVYIIRHTVYYTNRVWRIFRTGSVFFLVYGREKDRPWKTVLCEDDLVSLSEEMKERRQRLRGRGAVHRQAAPFSASRKRRFHIPAISQVNDNWRILWNWCTYIAS